MPDKHIRGAITELRRLGWRVDEAGPRAKVYATAKCPEGGGVLQALLGTPRVPENEAEKIFRMIRRHEERVRQREEEEKRQREGEGR